MKNKILVVDDEPNIREMIKDSLELADYTVVMATNGKEALEKIYSEVPDLILLDVRMPEMGGYEVCQKIRDDLLVRNLPIIMLTAQGEERDELMGLSKGADDYLVKPFRTALLLARIEMVLRRTMENMDSNPLTHLPGNNAIIKNIEARINSQNSFAVIYMDLNKFKSFNDYYGFVRGDGMIKFTEKVIVETFRDLGNSEDFLGHIGGDDFIAITSPDKVEITCKQIIKVFDSMVPDLYNEEDRKKGYIIIQDRRGEKRQFPFVSIAIAVVTNKNKKITHPAEVSAVATELKKFVKKEIKSAFIVDRRKK
ncbi:response regulator [bacterium]|nr:response regulator [bacterium]